MAAPPAAILPLGEDEVDVWLTRLATLEPHVRQYYAQRLSAGEQERWRRFLAQGAADQYLTGRVLLRTTLSRYAAVPEEAWAFETNAYGCPFVVAPACHRDLRFNLSHTEGLVACAVTRGGEIGVDVENSQRVLDPLAIAPTVFAPAEIDDLAAAPPEERHRRFLAYWTLKEAYIKARGMGVSLPLDAFWFELGDGAPRLHFGDRCPDRAERWHVSRWQPTPNHPLALAVATPAGRAPRIRLHWVLLPPPGAAATGANHDFRADGPPGSP